MVTSRLPGNKADLFRRKSKEYFSKFSQGSFTRLRYTPVLNARGRLESQTTATNTIKGDLQFDNKLLKEYIDMGIAVVGDGIFYTPYDSDIEANDEITTPQSTVWKLTQQVEGEYMNGKLLYQAWIATRKPL